MISAHQTVVAAQHVAQGWPVGVVAARSVTVELLVVAGHTQ